MNAYTTDFTAADALVMAVVMLVAGIGMALVARLIR